jgi:hypothetical protein
MEFWVEHVLLFFNVIWCTMLDIIIIIAVYKTEITAVGDPPRWVIHIEPTRLNKLLQILK